MSETEKKFSAETTDEIINGEKRTTITISMSVKEKAALKIYAAKQGKTSAAIVQEWIAKFCK